MEAAEKVAKSQWVKTLHELRRNLDSSIRDSHENDIRRAAVIAQLTEIGWHNVLELDPDLNFVIVSKNDEETVSLKLDIPQAFPKDPVVIVNSALNLEVSKTTKMADIFEQFATKVEQFKPIRQALSGLENRTRVLEPPPPDQALWDPRRIVALGPGTCLEITLDPEDPGSVPKILVLGPDRKIKPISAALASNVHKYDPDLNLADNLERILEITLPPPALEEADSESFNVDCGICYVYKLGDSIPSEVCDNSHCAQPFHVECLYEHLRTSHGATKSNNTIFGKCPFCESDIFCQQYNH